MKIFHTSKLRAEAKHDVRQRQLLAFAAVLLLGGGALWQHQAGLLAALPYPASGRAPSAVPSVPSVPSAPDELRAAKLLGAALLARDAGQEDLAKLDRIFADLEMKYPRDVEIKNGRAEFLYGIGERRRAMDTWLAAEKIDPSNVTVLDHLGGGFVDDGQVRKGADYYRRATLLAPNEAVSHYSYANVLFLFRHELLDAAHPDAEAVLKQALEEFAAASRLQPLDANYARAFAETFYTMPTPDWATALLAWQHFYEISPQKDFALINLARVHLKLGHKAEAQASLTQIQSSKYERVKAHLSEQIERK